MSADLSFHQCGHVCLARNQVVQFMKLFGVPYTIFTVCKLYAWHGNVHTVPLLIFFKRFRLFVNIISFGVSKPSCLVQADIDLDDFYT